jgi:hypothetical protein
MALTYTLFRNIKLTGKAIRDKHYDASGMYLLVKPAGTYWRRYYRLDGARKTLAFGVYPVVCNEKAR